MENLTRHALPRMQQRGIPPARSLIDAGAGRGNSLPVCPPSRWQKGRLVSLRSSIFTLPHANKEPYKAVDDARTWQHIALPRASGGGMGWGQLEKHLNAYAVLTADGTVATVGHRYKRIRRR